MNDANKIVEMQKKRFLFLKTLHDKTNGNERQRVNQWHELGEELGLSQAETSLISQYLAGEGLIKHLTIGGGIGITHEGVCEVESAIANPEKPSRYFPPVNIINVEQMINSQIQQGVSDSSQTITYSQQDLEGIKLLLIKIKTELNKLALKVEKIEEAKADISTIEAQLASPTPKHSVIKECISTLRTVFESGGGHLLAIELAKYLASH